ncbi:MAG TPA: hypothetical protein VJA47_06380 [archaeon]|nr:hypothetical protein [archaeon]
MEKRPLNLEVAAALSCYYFSEKLGRYVRIMPINLNPTSGIDHPVVLTETFPPNPIYMRNLIGKVRRGSRKFIDWRVDKTGSFHPREQREEIIELMGFPEKLPSGYVAYVFDDSGNVIKAYRSMGKVRELYNL